MIRTTVAGSWPLPARFAKDLRRYQRGEIADVRAEGLLRDAAAVAIREQKMTGVGQIMGGEVFADPHLCQLPRYLRGIQPVRRAAGAGGTHGEVEFYRIVGPLAAPRGIGYAAAFRRESALDAQLAKASCPGPFSLLSFLLLTDPGALADLPSAIDIVQWEIRALAQAGAREIQLDAPGEANALCLFGRDPQEVAAAIGGAFRHVTNAVRTVHFSYRLMASAAAAPAERLRALLPAIRLLRNKVDRVVIECVDPESRGLLKEVPHEMEVVAGVAETTGKAQLVDLLISRGRDVLRYVDAERLWLSPACGFSGCARERAVEVLINLVAAARRLPM